LLTHLFLHHIPLRPRRSAMWAAKRGALLKRLGEATIIFRYPHRVLHV
jgi:hypothetical protein